MLLPRQMIHSRLIEGMQQLAANTEGSQLPKEVKSSLSVLTNSISVAFPVKSVDEVNTEVFLLLHSLWFFSFDGDTVPLIPGHPKIHNHLLCFVQIRGDCSHIVPQSGPPALCTQLPLHHWYTPHLQGYLSVSAEDWMRTGNLRCGKEWWEHSPELIW